MQTAIPQNTPRIPSSLHIVVFALIAAAATVTAPVFVYALSLALFGLPHVYSEMGYIRIRFAGRFPRNLVLLVLCGLFGFVLTRSAAATDLVNSSILRPIELILAASLVGMVMPWLFRVNVWRVIPALVFVMLLLFGAFQAPIETLLILAILHNLTPIGFVFENRSLLPIPTRVALVWAFVLMPILVAGVALLASEWKSIEFLPARFAGGDARALLSAFIAPEWKDEFWAWPLFTLAAYLQVIHYAAVIHFLPRLVTQGRSGSETTPPPRRRVYVVTSTLLTIGFCLAFFEARVIYAIPAALHAFIEWPLLLSADYRNHTPSHAQNV